ncbi:MAG: Protease TldD [Promethearchaeota archaeon]|nr:MAG: Protease TldD [Candidatus Lokiarchaeota archaeon]
MTLLNELKIFDNNLSSRFEKIAENTLEYWDLRATITSGTMIEFTNNKSKEMASYQKESCGIRTFSLGGWGFLTLEDLSKAALINSFEKAVKLAKLSEAQTDNKYHIKQFDPINDTFELKVKKKVENTDISEKIELVKDYERTINEYDPKIKNTNSIYYDAIHNKIFLNSFGSKIIQIEPICRSFCMAYAQKNGLIQRSRNSIGGLGGFELFDTNKAQELGRKTAKEAVELLDAKSPKGGQFTIIMDPELTGTFIHEAFGHAVEADYILSKESMLEGRRGEQVALEEVSIKDDPRLGKGKELGLPYELFGSYKYDDEGIPSQEIFIIEKGILKNFLHNLESASRMNEEPNGHGRAASVSIHPQVRMGITTLSPGDWSLEEMIEDIKEGVFCEAFQYGYTDPASGNFQFKCKLSYKIEKGERTKMMRDVSLTGMTLEVLNKITALGREINYSDGMCGKGGQGVRVCDGGPYVRIKNITVGGLN